MSNDSLGNRMKAYEEQETHARFLPNVPIIARIDGRCFSGLTRKLERPFDPGFSELMRCVTYHLVKETGACIGYTQSDEINLCWYTPKIGSAIFFDGRKFKMTSQLAALATAYFHVEGAKYLDPVLLRQKAPTFDTRVFQVPTLEEGVNAFLWRQRDCRKNAISMVARSIFSHKELINKNGRDMLQMIEQSGVCFADYPWQSREGAFLRREVTEEELTPEELSQIDEDYHPANKIVMRSQIVELQLPLLSRLENSVDVVFFGAEPLEKVEV